MNPYNDYIEMKNKLIENWYNTGFITLDERNELYITITEIEEPNNFMDIPDPISSNEKSYGLYNRESNFLSNPFFNKNHNFFNIKSIDGRYHIKSQNNIISLMEETEISDTNKYEIEWNVIRDNTDFIRLADSKGAYLNIDKNKKIIINSNGEDIKSQSNLWKLKKIDTDNSNSPTKYYVESVLYPNYRIEFSDKLILSTGISEKNVCVFTPIEEDIETKYGKSEILLELEKELEIYANTYIELLKGKQYIKVRKKIFSENNANLTNIKKDIGNISSTNIEIMVNLYGLHNIISYYLEKQSLKLRTNNFKNARFLGEFKKDKENYTKIKEDLSNINNKSTNLEDNIFILNENNNYNTFKIKAIYFIRLCFIVIVLLLFISICKNVYKMIN
tara:strand:- start:155 stop:1324 length:1170 start_codon:yes stop_codon:yes gene_type:complete